MRTSATSSDSKEDIETSVLCNISNKRSDTHSDSSMEQQSVVLPANAATEAAAEAATSLVSDHQRIDRDNDHASHVSNENLLDNLNDDEESMNNPMENETSKRDTKRVVHLKLLVILILVVSAAIISVVVYRYILASETKQFRSKFRYDAAKVFTAISSSVQRTLGALNAVTITLVSYANDGGDDWPFVTLPDFALYASKLLPLTDGLYVAVAPIVQPSQKQAWEDYSYQHDYWVNESLAIQDVWDGYHGNFTYNWTRNESIYGAFGEIESNISRYMLPEWQKFPVVTQENGDNPYNWDWNSELYPEPLQLCIESQRVILTASYMIPIPDDDVGNAEMREWAKYFKSFLEPGEEVFEPMLDVYYPIVNDLSPNAVAVGLSNASTAPIVGMLIIPIYVRSFLRNILAEGSDGMLVVVHNPCNPSFTYQLNGANNVYLGVGDLHDNKYDDLVIIKEISNLQADALSNAGYSGAPVNTEYCPYTLHVYPSDIMKSKFVTNDATLFLISVIFIFAFVSGVFFIYDCYVEQRQHRVKSAAMYSSAIVSSLFPSTVRARLYPAPETNQKAKRRLSGFLAEPMVPIVVNCDTTTPIIGDPIAQEYLETTVIFADIVGFTAWSSNRGPIQVFHLFESIYAGFDSLAKVHGVFKIETIGDSYVAVVGLPKPQKRHAVVMVKFADAMRTKMKELTNELEKTLGAGTSSLSLRIGLNSGPTTAGVLRGEKARFQLFGDTVNTASRMESNGEPYKIHISETTATLLRAAGKEHWLIARDEMIIAKGKGHMQTYWCEPCSQHIPPNEDCD